MINAMSDTPPRPPDSDPVPDGAQPADSGAAETTPQPDRSPTPYPMEDPPEWLLRIRARREAEQSRPRPPARRPAPPAPPPAELAGQAPVQAGPGEAPVPGGDSGAAATETPTGPVTETPAGIPAGIPAGTPDEPPEWLASARNEAAQIDPSSVPPWVQAAARPAAAIKPAAAPPAAEPAPPDAPIPESEEEARAARRARLTERRQARRERARREQGMVGAFQSVVIVGAAAVLIATIFTFWTPASFLSDQTREGLRPAYATLSAQNPPTPIPTPVWLKRIGIVSGHWGPHPSTGRSDPGAVCEDGLTEASVNRSVAQLVVQALSGRGYQVDLLDEWDPRLENYEAAALLSIHADSCHEFDMPGATGYKVAAPSSRTTTRSDDQRLVDCLIQHYGAVTGMPLHPSITRDMTEYHNFGELSSVTPGAIIELGFLFEDRQILTEQPDLLAQGIVDGLLCFLEAAPPTPLPELTPWATAIATPTPLETFGPA